MHKCSIERRRRAASQQIPQIFESVSLASPLSRASTPINRTRVFVQVPTVRLPNFSTANKRGPPCEPTSSHEENLSPLRSIRCLQIHEGALRTRIQRTNSPSVRKFWPWILNGFFADYFLWYSCFNYAWKDGWIWMWICNFSKNGATGVITTVNIWRAFVEAKMIAEGNSGLW